MSAIAVESRETVGALIGPARFSPDPTSPFFMAKEEWIEVQAYASLALTLPVTDNDVRSTLGLADEDPEFGFSKPLAGVFASMSEHCLSWQTQTYPMAVRVAHRISDYATVFEPKAKALEQVVQRIVNAIKADDQAARERAFVVLEKTVQQFTEEARDNELQARNACDQIKKFADQTLDDTTRLRRVASNASEEMKSSDEAIARIEERLKELLDRLEQLRKEHNTAVIVAATTPTYLLVPFIGPIAIPIVAGIFGTRAVQLRADLIAISAEIESYEESMRQKLNLVGLLTLTQSCIEPVQRHAEAALAVVEKACGIWDSIASDISAIPGTLRYALEDTNAADQVLAAMDLDTAIEQWRQIGRQADHFRVNAFLEVQKNDE